MLSSIENRFNSFSKKIIIEIFLLSAIVFYFIFYFLSETILVKENIVNKTPLYKEDIYTVYSKIKKIDDINIVSSKVTSNNIDIKVKGTFPYLIKIINEIENINDFIQIQEYKIQREIDSFYTIYLKINSNKFQNKTYKYTYKYIKIEKTKEVLKEIQTPKIEQDFILNAIVFNKAIINGKILKKDDYINEYKLKTIKDKSVILVLKSIEKEVFIDGK